MRFILYTGKGGVGKTSISAATALRIAELGKKTLLISTDAAHSLQDSLGTNLGREPTRIADNLWGQEIDSLYEMERSWRLIGDYIKSLLSLENFDDVTLEELMVFPGMEELFNLLEIERHEKDRLFDVVVVDCAPTGETLRLLSYPDAFRWWMERLFPIQRKAIKVIRPIAQPLMKVPLPTDQVLDSVNAFYRRVLRTQEILTDRVRSTVRLVLNLEKMVIRESQRSFTYLNLFGFHVDAVIVNRLLPDHIDEEFFGRWKALQGTYMSEVADMFSPVPVLQVPLFQEEVCGRDALLRMAAECFGERDPSDVFFNGSPQTVAKEGDRHVMSLSLPFAARGEVSLSQRGEELVIKVGQYKRNVLLPKLLAGLNASSAKFEDQTLKITFEEVK